MAEDELRESERLSALRKKLQASNELPIFDSYPHDGTPMIPIYEVARITYVESPFTYPSQKRQINANVVGISSNFDRIYFTEKAKLMDDGMIVSDGYPYGGGEASICNISKYEVLIPHEELLEPSLPRRI